MGIDIQPANVKPTVGSPSPSLVEGQTVSIDPNINLGDAYDLNHPYTITIENVVTGGQGTFTYVNAAGDTVTLQPKTTYQLTLAESKTLKFAHNGAEPNAPGAIAPSYTITVTDAGGGEAGVSSSTSGAVNVTLNITPINDDPIFSYDSAGHGSSASTPLVLPESADGNDSKTNLDGYLNVTDNDINAQDKNLVYTLTSRPTTAEIQLYIGGTAGYGGDGWVTLGVGARFTQADVDAGHVRILQTGNAETKDSFTFEVRDSVYGPAIDANGNIIPGQQEGAVRDDDGSIKNITFYLQVDADASDNNTYPDGPREPTPGYGSGSGNSNTTTTENGTSTVVTGPKGEIWTNEIKATVTDPGNKAGDSTLIWNEANVGAVDGGYTITNDMLGYEIVRSLTDSSGTYEMKVPEDEVVYTLLSEPANGSVQINEGGVWKTLSSLDQFTQADIDAGHIRFVSNGNETHDSSFSFAVSDGTNLSFTSQFTIDITPTNDRPSANGGSTIVTEGDGNTIYLGSGQLGMSDADNSATTDKHNPGSEGVVDPLWFQITSLPAEGKLEYYDSTTKQWVQITSSNLDNWYSPDLLVNGGENGQGSGLRYTHNGSEPLDMVKYPNGPHVNFQYQVRDDWTAATSSNEIRTGTAPTDTSAQGHLSDKGTVTINVTPVNNEPQIKVNPDSTNTPSVSGTIPGGGATTAVNEILNVNESGTGQITSDYLVAIDSDNSTVQRQYEV